METIDKQKRWLFSFGKLVTMPALFLLVFLAGSMTAYAAEVSEYNLYIGSTPVNAANQDDIFGDGTASYDPDTKTLYLNGVSIGEGNSHYDDEFGDDGYNYSLYAGTDAVKHLVIEGDNNFASADNGMFFKVTGPTSYDNVFANHSLLITGTGTLTSTVAGDGYEAAAMTVVGETNQNMGTGKGGVFMGNTDGTGPRLELNGVRKGANFYETGRVQMQGGTIIAKATGEPGTGVTLPPISNIGGETYFEGGTIVGFGTYAYDEINDMEYGGAFEGAGHVSTSQLGMQRVYPEPEEGETNYSDESGWCVVGMTQGDHVADSQAVLSELSLDSSGGGTDPGTDPTDPGTDPTNPDDPGTDPTNPDNPGTDPTNPDNPGTDPTNPDNPGTEGNRYHTDMVPEPGVVNPKFGTDIDVQGYTTNTTVYSVDVEWGAMTFQYEKSSWDPESHTSEPGKGWVVYDNVNDKVLDSTQDAINKITVTNRSNAEVYATLSYAGNGSYADIGGGFTTSAADAATVFTEAAASVPAYLTLATAKNGLGEGGANQATVGTVYFMPNGIGTTDGAVNDISQWTVIGKITVGLQTEQPTEQP